ncbi:hypothetical protein [Luteolibacter soli]|uniref:DUF3592 domain-containing protein n=1 Tax=Luteolibacter soli TaxID=3135280 RepID=A0ABU9AVA9_9BACT
MPPRPIHHWKSLWLGLLVLTFLSWGWAYSFRTEWHIAWCLPSYRSQFSGDFEEGTVQISRHRFPPPTKAPSGFLCYSSHPTDPSPMWLPLPWTFYHADGNWSFTLSFWFLILLFLIPWLAFLLWRRRRMKHHPTHQP